MAIDKAIEYQDQKLTKKQKKKIKPANQGGGPNYLGKQEMVTVPKKWLSDPDHVVAELAYITPREQKILLDENLYGSLKGKPNKGPGGIMSLQGDLGGWSSPAKDTRSGTSQGKGGGGSGPDYKNTNYYKMMTGQKNIGQTVKTGPKTKKYAVPEYVNVKQKDGTYKNKYIGSGYKSYGQPSFFGNLFSRGAPGYRGIKGMPAFWGKPGFEAKQGPQGFGYYSDKENFGETRDAFPLGIVGLLSNLANKFKKPKDMSEFNELGLYDERVNPDYYNDLDNELMLSTQKTPERFLPNAGPKPVNIPSNKVSYVPFSNYGKAAAATGTTVDGVPIEEWAKGAAIAPTPVEQLRDKAYTGIKENVGKPISNFLNSLMNADKIAALENEYGSKYGITDTAGGISSDARHMAAMNELSNSLSPMDNKFGNFIGDALAYGAGAVNEIPALFRGFDSKNLREIKEDLAANWKGSFGTPNQTTAEQIYGDVFKGSTPSRTASIPTYGTAAAEDITIDGGMLNSPFMENQIGPRIIEAENAYYNQGKMPPEFLGDRIRMNMELGNARGFMGPGFADGGIASMFTRRG